ncbi:MAG: SDR family NAD(P)-dependent oxidoreductase [Mycetocola sp.]
MGSKVIVITGASDGIGASAARQLSRRGHTVVVVGRSPEKTQRVATEIGADWFTADFASLDSVRRLAAELLAAYPRIDVLANNAGGIFGRDRQATIDGNEMTFQVNYLAPFLLTQLLLDRLIASGGTVINTSSVANRLFGHINLTDLNATRSHSAQKAYGDAKLAQILFTTELDRRYRAQGVTSTAFHPGVIATGFSSDRSSPMYLIYQTPLRHLFLTSPERGAATLVHLAEGAPGVDYPTGEYFAKRRTAKRNPQGYDAELARALWDESERMLADSAG